MSKGNMLLGHARGKVGDLVFSRQNGQQVTRARAAVVKNPKTRAQIIQRILLNTVAQAYSLMSPIVDHSFEGVQQGQKTMSLFLSKNLKSLRERLAAADSLDELFAFTPLGSNIFAMNPYEVSKGSLPSVVPTLPLSASGLDGVATLAISGNTYGDIISQFGLQRGDQLTFCLVKQISSRFLFHFARVILNPMGADGSELSLTTTFVENNAIVAPSDRNEGEFSSIAFANGKLTYDFAGGANAVATFIIVSRQKADGTWQRSNANMVINDELVSLYAYDMETAIANSEGDSVGVASDVYLNNAGKAKVLAATPFSTKDSSGNTVTLVGLQSATYGTTPVLAARSDSGKLYALQSNDKESMTYGKLLKSSTGSIETAWVAKPENAEGSTVVEVILLPTVASYPVPEFNQWLLAQGVSYTVFATTTYVG